MIPLIERLERFYGPLPQPPEDPFANYVWGILSVHTTPSRRDAALTALKRIPAMTPDSMARAPRAKLEAAVVFAGPYREERLAALMAGVDAFRRNTDLSRQIAGGSDEATAGLAVLSHLTAVYGQWLLLFAGSHACLPEDPNLARVIARLGTNRERLASETGEVLTALQRTALYLAHHGRATCLEGEPLCHICPVKRECPYPARATP
jgi:endonuclease III